MTSAVTVKVTASAEGEEELGEDVPAEDVAPPPAAGGGTHQKGGGKQRSGKFFELFHFWFSFQCVHFTLLI